MSSTGSEYGSQAGQEDPEIPSNPMIESQLTRFKLTEDDIRVLIRYRERWQVKKGKDRTSIAIEAYEKILTQHSEFGKGNTKEGKEQRKLIREVCAGFLEIRFMRVTFAREYNGGCTPTDGKGNQLNDFTM